VDDKDQTIKVKCDFVISAFGSQLADNDVQTALAPLKFTS
jgi:dihydropyrimidine dehydrogenase (NADP+)